jgi:hypothetical protein
VGRIFFTFKNRITECTSHSAGLVIDMALYKAPWRINQFIQWLGKHWRRDRGSEDSSRPSFSVNDLRGLGAQAVLTLKMTYTYLIQSWISPALIIVTGHIMGHSKHKIVHVRVSYSERFPRWNYVTVH